MSRIVQLIANPNPFPLLLWATLYFLTIYLLAAGLVYK
jgi:hypothetical protein